MDKTMKFFFGGFIALILLLLLLNMTKEKPVNWSPTYTVQGKNPYDLFVFNSEIASLFPENKFTKVKVTPFEYFKEHPEKMNIMLINQSVYRPLDSVMLSKVSQGSNLFISAENITRSFTDTLNIIYQDADTSLVLKSKDWLMLTLTSNNWNEEIMTIKPVTNSFSFQCFDTFTTTVLGEMQLTDKRATPSFLKVKFGKGTIFLHNQPSVFSNYALLYNPDAPAYVSHLLACLPKNLPVAWMVYEQETAFTSEEPSSLSVIFRYPALRATWLIFIYGLFLYVLFHAKRRQRVVPVIKPLKNTTVEFVQTIGNLYFLEGSEANLMDKKIIYFLDRVRTCYYLDTSVLDDTFAQKLQSKSGKELDLIQQILQVIIDYRKWKTVIRDDLFRFNNLIDEFWN